jgi:hypothetical protein
LSDELSKLVSLVKGSVGEGTEAHESNMGRIRDLISKLSAANNTSIPTGTAPSSPQMVSDLPSKTSSVNTSLVDTVGSAINSIGSALNLNSSKSSESAAVEPAASPAAVEPAASPAAVGPAAVEPAASPAAVEPAASPAAVEPAAVEPAAELTEADKKVLAEEKTVKSAANNKEKENNGSNMFDINEYAANNMVPPPQDSLDNTITPESVEEGLAATGTQQGSNTSPVMQTTGNKTSANKQNTNNKSKTANNKPLTPLPDRMAEGNPSGMLVPKQAEPSKNSPPAGNLPSAIANLNKIQQEQQPHPQEPQQQPQTGGARTLKKKTKGMLSSVADVLGITNTNTTQKNPASKRGRPRKTK